MAADLLLNWILSQCDPVLPDLRYHSAGVAAVTRTLRRAGHDECVEFTTAKARADFLDATWRHLAPIHDHEELIVGFGQRRGPSPTAGSRLTHLWRGVGGRDSVQFTDRLILLIGHHTAQRNGEVLLVHNHPDHAIKSVLDYIGLWRPVPSSQDRATALAFNLAVLRDRLESCGSSRLRWFLVDEKQLGEFRLPSIEWFTSMLSRV